LRPDPEERHVQILDQQFGTPLQNVSQVLVLAKDASNLRAQRYETHLLCQLILHPLSLGDVEYGPYHATVRAIGSGKSRLENNDIAAGTVDFGYGCFIYQQFICQFTFQFCIENMICLGLLKNVNGGFSDQPFNGKSQ
jgi:hypothetical protein